jgi:hypothetical protein
MVLMVLMVLDRVDQKDGVAIFLKHTPGVAKTIKFWLKAIKTITHHASDNLMVLAETGCIEFVCSGGSYAPKDPSLKADLGRGRGQRGESWNAPGVAAGFVPAESSSGPALYF